MRKLFYVILYTAFFTHFYCYISAESSVSVSVVQNKVDMAMWPQYKRLTYIVKVLSAPLSPEIFSRDTSSFVEPLPIANRLLFYGPSCDKTIVAQEIALASDCKCITIHALSIVDKCQGSGAENIRNIFENALEVAEESGRPVIVLIEGIDAIALESLVKSHAECGKAIQQFRYYLDKHKRDPRLFIICTTNDHKKLDLAFVSHFSGDLRLKVSKLNAKNRQKVLARLIQEYKIEIDANLMDNLVYYSEGMSIFDLENFISHIRMLIKFESPLTDKQLLKEIKSYSSTQFDHRYKIIAGMAMMVAGYIVYKKYFDKSNKASINKNEILESQAIEV